MISEFQDNRVPYIWLRRLITWDNFEIWKSSHKSTEAETKHLLFPHIFLSQPLLFASSSHFLVPHFLFPGSHPLFVRLSLSRLNSFHLPLVISCPFFYCVCVYVMDLLSRGNRWSEASYLWIRLRFRWHNAHHGHPIVANHSFIHSFIIIPTITYSECNTKGCEKVTDMWKQLLQAHVCMRVCPHVQKWDKKQRLQWGCSSPTGFIGVITLLLLLLMCLHLVCAKGTNRNGNKNEK